MKRTKEKGTKEQIIYLADLHICARGFNAFSFGEIAGIMDIRKAAVHYHFRTKADLGISVIDAELQKVIFLKKSLSYLPADQEFQKLLETFMHASQKGTNCLIGSFVKDYDDLSDDLRKKADDLNDAILDYLATCLEKGRKDGHFDFQGDATDRALLAMSALLSSLLFTKVWGQEAFARIIMQLLKDIGSGINFSDLKEETPEYLL